MVYWIIFFKFNNYSVNNLDSSNNKVMMVRFVNLIKPNDLLVFINCFFLLFLLGYFIYFCSNNQNFWWNHFYLCEVNLNFCLIVIFFNWFFVFILKIFFSTNESFSYDLIFSIINLTTTVPLFFTINNLFLFFFYLEFVSIFIFFMYVVSRIWFSQFFHNYLSVNFNSVKYLNLGYLNLLFFQFWSSFFSSVIIVFVIILLLNIFNSVEWAILNYLNLNQYFLSGKFYQTEIIFFLFFFILAFLVKMGFSPVHFFKLEIFKGLSFIVVFFYTTFYFLVFFFLLLFLFVFYFNSFLFIWYFCFLIFLVFGLVFSIHFLFDINYLKFFFAYSSIMNSIVFFFIITAFLI